MTVTVIGAEEIPVGKMLIVEGANETLLSLYSEVEPSARERIAAPVDRTAIVYVSVLVLRVTCTGARCRAATEKAVWRSPATSIAARFTRLWRMLSATRGIATVAITAMMLMTITSSRMVNPGR